MDPIYMLYALSSGQLGYIGLVVVTLVLGIVTQAYINSSYKKYSRVGAATGMTGAETARRMLDANGLHDVDIVPVSGTLSDHYDPRTRTVRLSEGVYGARTVSAMAVACHECGHAVQHAVGYVPLRLRTTLVPIANFGSSAWLVLLVIGIALQISQLFWLAIVFYAFAVLFQIVTLPVEFDASRRGLAYVHQGAGSGMPLASEQESGARTVLRAAALTYVAAALTSVMQLLYFIGLARND